MNMATRQLSGSSWLVCDRCLCFQAKGSLGPIWDHIKLLCIERLGVVFSFLFFLCAFKARSLVMYDEQGILAVLELCHAWVRSDSLAAAPCMSHSDILAAAPCNLLLTLKLVL